MVDNDKLASLLSEAGYTGFLAVEIDAPAPEWLNMEDEAIAVSVHNLKKIGAKYK
jgi:sugar phosphate isomerase/epimerase